MYITAAFLRRTLRRGSREKHSILEQKSAPQAKAYIAPSVRADFGLCGGDVFAPRCSCVRNRSQPVSSDGRGGNMALWHVLQKPLLLEVSNSAWHFVTFQHVSRRVESCLCVRCITFASFSQDDTLHLSWQEQRFGDLHRHFAWQAQHFRRVVLRVFFANRKGCFQW